MRKSMTTMMMLMTSMFGCAACSSDGASKEAADVSENDNVPTDFQIQYTTPVPSEFFQAATQQGATLGNSANLRSLTGRTDLPQASAVIMQYTGYTTVSQYDSSTYACCGTSDGIASWRTMQSRLESLSALGIPTEFHSYNGLPHGFGLGTGTIAEGWINDAVHFWQSQSGSTSVRSTKANTKQSDSIYSLNGTRRHAMQKGVSIVNGKKVMTK